MRHHFVLLAIVLAVLFFLLGGIAVAQEPNSGSDAAIGGNQTVKNDLLSHRQVFQSLSKSPFLRGKGQPLLASQASTAPTADRVDKAMSQYTFVWSSADGIDTGSAFLFPGADPESGIKYVFGALSNGTIIGVTPTPERNAVRILELSTGNVAELPTDGRPSRLIQYGSSLRKGQKPGGGTARIEFPGIASNIASAASCLWDRVTSTLHVQSWSDFANLTCSLNSFTDSRMWDFGKEVTGCASVGLADCFFLASDIALFIGSPSCRPDWVNSCILNQPPQGGGGNGGGTGPAIISSITPLSTPTPGQQFYIQIRAVNLVPFAFSVVFTGPGCPNTNSCVVPYSVITDLGSGLINVPVTLAQGNFVVFINQGGVLSLGYPFTVGAAGTPPPSGGGSLNITFNPNPVARSSDNAWYYQVNVNETSGVAVNLTGMTVGGGDYTNQISSWFGTNTVPANGHISVSIKTTGSPGSMVWLFSSGNRSWSAPVNLN